MEEQKITRTFSEKHNFNFKKCPKCQAIQFVTSITVHQPMTINRRGRTQQIPGSVYAIVSCNRYNSGFSLSRITCGGLTFKSDLDQNGEPQERELFELMQQQLDAFIDAKNALRDAGLPVNYLYRQ